MKPVVPEPALLFIVDWQPGAEIEPLLAVAEQALQGGVNWIHLRAPQVTLALCLKPAQILRRLTDEVNALFSINRHLSVALQVGADGIHLPEGVRGKQIEDITKEMLIGRSVHSVESAVQAVQEGCDYLIVGTLFETSSHPGKEPEGLRLLKAIQQRTNLSLIGIGGITPERAPACIRAGATGIAAISAFAQSPDPAETARRFIKNLS